MGGGGFDGGEGHGGLEAAQPVPALDAGFDGAADVGGDVAAEDGDHLGTAAHAGRPGGDVVAAGGGDHRHDVDAELGGDVCVGAQPGEVLLAQPGRVDRGGLPGIGEGDAVRAGAGGEEL